MFAGFIAQREALIAMREDGRIDNMVLRRLQGELDLAALTSELRDEPDETSSVRAGEPMR